MVTYTVTVPGAWLTLIFIQLVGTKGESKRTWLFSFQGLINFFLGRAKTITFSVEHPESLGELRVIVLEKRSIFFRLPAWFVSKIEITSPEGDVYHFPIACWIDDRQPHLFREAKEAEKHGRKPLKLNKVNMLTYTVTVPGAWLTLIFIKLVGTKGESKRTCLFSFWGLINFVLGRAKTITFSLDHDLSLGELRGIALDKRSLFFGWPAWFVSKIEITSPEGEVYHFPVYRWIADGVPQLFRESRAWSPGCFEAADALQEADALLLTIYGIKQELKQRNESYRWDDYAAGVPHCIQSGGPLDLPAEVRFSFTKKTTFFYNAATSLVELNLQGVANSRRNWTNIEEIAQFWKSTTGGFWLFQLLYSGLTTGSSWLLQLLYPWLIWVYPWLMWVLPRRIDTKGRAHQDKTRCVVREYVQEHWKDDAFFGYQYLNGINPILIRRCTALPDNFPVTNDMLSLAGGRSLEEEMKNGNIFLCDYKNLDGVRANLINGEKQYLTAPLVLLHSSGVPGLPLYPQDSPPVNTRLLHSTDQQLLPVAIQLKQEPSEDNPIFLPTDSEYDWLLAKIYVRGAEFAEHQLESHLLRTHLLAEVFAVSLLRNVPMVHPLYKLLVPHTRYTLQINNLARGFLISQNGFFSNNAASGGQALGPILQRSMDSLTYSSLCPPDDIKERGVQRVPGYYYRDDALQLWPIIHRYVKGILGYYYKTDADVQRDNELQKWIKDIFEHGFHSNASSGVPQSLSSVDELVKFATMVIFTVSAQHNAVNAGQFDYGGWIPNAPPTLRRPPPTTKGISSEKTVMETLPDVGITAQGMATTWMLSKKPTDFVQLGHHREDHFSEETPLGFIKRFQEELEKFSVVVHDRNKDLDVPYTYMDPKLVENSVAI